MSLSCRSVAFSFTIPVTYLPIGSSSESFPSCSSCSRIVAVMVLVRLPTRVWSVVVGARSTPSPAVPVVPTQSVPPAPQTPTTAPGKPTVWCTWSIVA